MNREQTPKSPAAKTGLFATLSNLLPTTGTTAPSHPRRTRSLAATFLAATCALALAPSALAARPHTFSSAFGEPGSAAGQVQLLAAGTNEPGSGIAVNQTTGDIYVADTGNHRVDQFSSAGSFIRAFGWGVEDGSAEAQTCTSLTGCQAGLAGTAPGQFEDPRAIAVDNAPGGEGDVYVADYGGFESPDAMVQKFTSEGALIETWGASGQLREGALTTNGETLFTIGGLVVDPSGNLWVVTDGLFKFSRAGAFIQRTPASLFLPGPGIAMSGDASGGVYLAASSAVDQFDSTGAHLGRVFAPQSSATGLGFDTTGDFAGELYVAEGTSIAVLPPSCLPSASPPFCSASTSFGPPQLTASAGLAVDSATSTVYAANPAANQIDAFGPAAAAAPEITVQSVTAITATSASFHAELNPRSESGEGPTTYSFQYGPCASAATCATSPFTGETTAATLAADFEPHPVSAAVEGLSPATLYHYRLVATNDQGTSAGEEEAGGEVLRTFTTQGTALFAPPDARQWQLVSPPEKLGALLEAHNQEGGIIQAAADGHAITYLANGATEPEPQGFNTHQQILSSRTTAGWTSRDIGLPHPTATGIAVGQGNEYHFFSQDLAAAAVQPFGQFDPLLSPAASESTAYLRDNLTGAYTPLVTSANVPAGTVFGEGTRCTPTGNGSAAAQCGPHFLGATSDLSHLVLTSEAPLTPGAGEGQLYEWAGGQLAQLSVLPGGGLAPVGPHFDPIPGTITADGDRVVWNTPAAPGALYLRDTVSEETLQLDQAEAGCPSCESGGGAFRAASPDGSRVFFTDTQQLVPGASTSGADLYECQIVQGEAGLECELTDLTPQAGGESAKIQGSGLAGASTDASRLYFVALGALTATPNQFGETALSGQPNLYRWHEGATTFIANLSPGDQHDWAGIVSGSAKASPDGEWLAFMSQRPLTGYDNRDAASGEPAAEVYLYDASANRLSCASCNPSGARPRSIDVQKAKLVGAELNWAGDVAASLPLTQRVEVGSAYQQPRYLADSGRLFFNAYDGLLPGDSNSTEDVYQYEPPTVGACTTNSLAFATANGGCLGLVSAGTSGSESAFLDASESGNDAFFLTRSRLVSQDVDSANDVYDAHVCSAEVPCLPELPPPAPACAGDACQQPATAPNDATPGSLTFSGAGNVLQCPKGKVKRGGKCVAKKHKAKKHHKKKGHKKQKRANSNRGGQK